MKDEHTGNWIQIRVSRPISRTIGIIAAEQGENKYEVVANAIKQAYPEYGNR